jgi:tetratricopeptide (TPR) repeat protein
MGDLVGHNLGPYRLLDQLGAGGMATVYKAYHAAMDRYVAIKVLPQHLARDPGFRARFQQEARVIARLEHRHILPVYDAAEEDGIPYLVMRYTDGGDLNNLIAARPTLGRLVELLAQVAEALGYAHRQGIIHRDVKPANVLIGRDGDALLADFGIAKIYADTLQLTGDGSMVGTPAYMAPEQFQGKGVDARADIYALGVVLYQALTGECPFVAETPLAVALMHLHNPLRPPSQLKPDIPEAIERVILRALAKNPDDRFQTAEEMAEALRSFSAAQHISPAVPPVLPAPQPTPVVEPVPAAAAPDAQAPRPADRRIWWFAGAGTIAIVLIAALAFGLMRGPSAAGTPTQTAAGQSAGEGAAGAPANAGAALDTAMRQIDVNDAGAALETLKPALAAYPDDPNLLAARGIANAIYSGADPARADIERALSLDANNPLVYYARGFLHQRAGETDPAIADFTRAIELDATFGRAYYQRGMLLGYPKNDQAAKQRDIDRAIELAPDFIAARMDRAYTRYYASDLAAALPDVDHVLSLNPKQSQALYLRALVYEGQNRAADARRDFDAAAAIAPEDRDILRERATFFARQGDFTAALADADRLVALDAAEPQWHGMRGFILHALGRDDQALAAFDKTLLIAGNETWLARYGRGLALLGLNRAQDALGDLTAAQEHSDDVASISRLLYGTSAMPSIDLARAYQALGQLDQAMQALNTAIEQDGSFVAYIERGRAYSAMGDRDNARADLQEALRRAVEAKDDKQRALVEEELKKIQ